MILIPKPSLLFREFLNKRKAGKASWNSKDIESVLAQYDLWSWHICNDLDGGNSDNILLMTSQGKKVLKRYYWSLPSTMQEHSILRHLAENEFPSPRLRRNREGLTYTELGERHYAIYDFIDGYRYSDYIIPAKTRNLLIKQTAAKLANFHELMVGFVPEGRKLNGFVPDGTKLWRGIDWLFCVLDEYLEKARNRRVPDKLERFLFGIKDGIKRGLIDTCCHFEKPHFQLPKVVIHGDYAPYNIVFTRKGIEAVLDFGDANLNLRAADVARGLSSFSRMGRYGIDFGNAKIFLQSYQEQQPLSYEEVAAIPDLIIWRYLSNIIWSIFSVMQRHRNQRLPEDHLKFVRQKWKSALWIKSHADKLQSVLLF